MGTVQLNVVEDSNLRSINKKKKIKKSKKSSRREQKMDKKAEKERRRSKKLLKAIKKECKKTNRSLSASPVVSPEERDCSPTPKFVEACDRDRDQTRETSQIHRNSVL